MDSGGMDVLMLAGVDPAAVRMWTDYTGALYIQYSASDTLEVQGTHSVSQATALDGTIDQIVFDNGTVWDLTKGLAMTDTADSHSIYGSVFNDSIDGAGGDDYIYGYAGNDTLTGGTGNNYLDGGLGVDSASFANSLVAVTASLATNTATHGTYTDTLVNIENLIGSAYNDTLTGDGNANVIEGGAGNDIMNGGAGVDTVAYAGASAAVTVSLAVTAAQNTGGAGTDTLSNFENVTGSNFNDTLTGNSGANVMHGGAGNDTLIGGGGADMLYGDAGADIFTFKAAALPTAVTVGDFKTAEADKLDLRDLLTAYDPVHQAITDFVHLTTSGANTIVSVDTDGTAAAHAFVNVATLAGVTGLDTHVLDLVASGNLLVH